MSTLALPSVFDKVSGKRVYLPFEFGKDVNDFETHDRNLWAAPVLRTLGLTQLATLADGRAIWAEGDDLDRLKAEAERLVGALDEVVQETGYEPVYVNARVGAMLDAVRQAIAQGGEVIIW